MSARAIEPSATPGSIEDALPSMLADGAKAASIPILGGTAVSAKGFSLIRESSAVIDAEAECRMGQGMGSNDRLVDASLTPEGLALTFSTSAGLEYLACDLLRRHTSWIVCGGAAFPRDVLRATRAAGLDAVCGEAADRAIGFAWVVIEGCRQIAQPRGSGFVLYPVSTITHAARVSGSAGLDSSGGHWTIDVKCADPIGPLLHLETVVAG